MISFPPPIVGALLSFSGFEVKVWWNDAQVVAVPCPIKFSQLQSYLSYADKILRVVCFV
jgi:hypothetical protein